MTDKKDFTIVRPLIIIGGKLPKWVLVAIADFYNYS
jgi:hypothetical protein